MSKDKGTKNVKKAPADKTSGKSKVVSDYKSESKSKQSSNDTFAPKSDAKSNKKA